MREKKKSSKREIYSDKKLTSRNRKNFKQPNLTLNIIEKEQTKTETTSTTKKPAVAGSKSQKKAVE